MGKFHSEKTKLKISLGRRGKFKGKENNFWKGGIAKKNRSFRAQVMSLVEYKFWVRLVFIRDNFVCQTCGITNQKGLDMTIKLEAHHKKEFQDIIKDNNVNTIKQDIECDSLWDINNGLTLCKKCHNLTKNGNQKRKLNRGL